MIYAIFAPRKRPYRRPCAGYRVPGYRTTSKAIPAIMNAELKDLQTARKQRQEN